MFRSVLMLIAGVLFSSCCATARPAADSAAGQPVSAPGISARANDARDADSPAAPGTVTASAESAEAAVRQASERFWRTRDQKDASLIAAQFTENGILMVPGVADAVGRDAIRDLLQARLNAVSTKDFKAGRAEITIAGDLAYELASFGETLVTMDGSTRTEGRYLLVWRHEPDGVWRVHRHLWNFSGMKPLPD